MERQSIEFLQGAFQSIKEAVIIETLRSVNGNVEEAMERLFTMDAGDNNEQEKKPNNEPEIDEDLRLAMELQRQFESEDNNNGGDIDARLARELSEQFMKLNVPNSGGNDEDEDARIAKQLQESEYYLMNQWGNNNYEEPDYQQYPSINLQEIFQAGINQNALNTLLDQVKEHMVPIVEDQFNELPPFEESFDVPKLGNFRFGIRDSIKLSSFVLPPHNIQLNLVGNHIHFRAEQISAELNKFGWFFQKSFPRISETGDATATMSGASVNMVLRIVMGVSGVSLDVVSVEVKVGKLNVIVSDNSNKFIYNLIINVAVRLLKNQLEKALAKLIRDAINEQGKSILGGVSF